MKETILATGYFSIVVFIMFPMMVWSILWLPIYELYVLSLWADLFKPHWFGLVSIIWYVPVLAVITVLWCWLKLLVYIQEKVITKKDLWVLLVLWLPVLFVPGVVLAEMAVAVVLMLLGVKQIIKLADNS